MNNQNPNYLLVTGMFRSGTTLLSKMCHAHRDIVCVPDVYTPVFNAFRDQIMARNGLTPVEPLSYLRDYFADQQGMQLWNAIQRADFNLEIDAEIRPHLLEKIRQRGRMTCPKIVESLTSLTGRTYKELYRNLIDRIEDAYGTGSEIWIGNKEVWILEFLPILAKAFPQAKFVIVNRDPRAVCASKNAGSVRLGNLKHEQYPWLFLIRQWRKLAVLTWHYQQQPELRDRIFAFRYEDMIRNPQALTTCLCDFLKLDLDPAMLDPAGFVDGRGDKWVQNSSYNAVGKEDGYLVFKEPAGSFDPKPIDKWKDVLTADEIEYIEQLCFPEMLLYGYEFSGSGRFGLPDSLVFHPPYIPSSDMQDWIAEQYKDYTKTDSVNETAQELLRQRMLLSPESQPIEPESVESYFIVKDWFETARQLIAPQTQARQDSRRHSGTERKRQYMKT